MNKKRVYDFICKDFTKRNIEEIIKSRTIKGKTAMDVQHNLKISRNNASTLLNELVRDKKLIKIETRPVYFLPRDIIKYYLGDSNIDESYNAENFLKELSKAVEKPDPFSNLIGYNASLKHQVEQAKAAVLYPPRGLHTLIVGESGTGKSLFAKTMHQFGLIKHELNIDEYPYVKFNCADYSNNPQLLMAQLFGYVQGAFTGANEDRIGLVEKAHNGILLLDEVHRLPPEGQEMLFLLMDTNKFRRLGEISDERYANVLIIAATTENPQRTLLKTFTRRIPVLIQMPPLNGKSIEEKVELVEYFFLKEAATLEKEIILKPEVMEQLIIRDYPGNIGQLSSEVKLLCAQAFLENQESDSNILIDMNMIRNKIPIVRGNKEIRFKENNKYFEKFYTDTIIKPNNEIDYQSGGEKFYDNLRTHIEMYTESGCTKEQIKKYLSKEIELYYQSMLQRFTPTNMKVDDLYKIIKRDIVDFTMEVLSETGKKLNVKYNKRHIVGFAFHIKYLLERIDRRKSLSETERKYIKKEYPREYGLAIEILEKIEQTFKCKVCEDEKYLITLLITNTANNRDIELDEVSIIVIAHGDTTASSMADVCNNLLGDEIILAVDMPLSRSIEDTYKEVIEIVQEIENTRGFIFLVDMGSLKNFGEKIASEMGIRVKTIDNVSIPLLLEVARNAMYKNFSLEQICENSVKAINTSIIQSNSNRLGKPLAILSVCVSGEGVGKAFKNIIETELQKSQLDYIKVFSFSYMDVKNKSTNLKIILGKYEIIGCIGNINPNLPVPFVHIEKILSGSGISEIVDHVEKGGYTTSLKLSDLEENPYKDSEAILYRYLTYLNPRVAVESAKEFISALNLNDIADSRELQFSLAIHLAFMLERIIMGQKVRFEGLDDYIKSNRVLYEKIKTHIPLLIKKIPSIKVSDSDICYIILAIKGK